MKNKILLVDDEQDIVEFLEYNLIQAGYEVISAFGGNEALEKIKAWPDLIVLDVMMPDIDGYQVYSKIRQMDGGYHQIPIIFLTAKSDEIDEIYGLNLGADDFIQKPTSPKKLIARIQSTLRRREPATVELKKGKESDELFAGPLKINKSTYAVYLDNAKIILPKKEFEILHYLTSNPGKVYSREDLLNKIWGKDIYVVERTIDVHIRKIREKLGKYGSLIETVKGVGYRFAADE
jgi:two-component system alkaline phosphatase synthesis response regulator PhoP